MAIKLTPEIPLMARSWRNHPEVFKWCRQHTLITEAHHEAWLKKIESDSTIHMFGITKIGAAHHEDIEIGVCGLTSIDYINRKAEFSLYIAPKFQKKGYGEQALKLLIDEGFKRFNLNRIWGEVFDENPAMNMFFKVGFKTEGKLSATYFRDGKFIDSHIISILRSET